MLRSLCRTNKKCLFQNVQHLQTHSRLFSTTRTFRNTEGMDESSNEFTYEDLKDEGIVVLTFNRVRYKNAISKAMLSQMANALDRVRFSQTARVVILRSAATDIFCSGADLKERAQMTQQETALFVHSIRKVFNEVETLPVPTIASVSGAALGGGLEISLACDLRVAEHTPKTIFGLTETALAIIPGAGGTQRLARTVGIAKAKELIYTAKRIDAKEAERIGLVNETVDGEGKAFERSLALARQIAANGPKAIKMAKIAIQEGMQMDRNSGMILEQQCYAQVIPTKDRLEGLLAFKEKRKPVYKGE
jgi:methylglutaconyl-CoA hydratase